MWSTLKATIPSTRQILLMCTVFGSLFTPAIGHMTSFIDPGRNAEKCPIGWEKEFEQTVDNMDPTLTYVHVPYDDDDVYDKKKVSRIYATVDQLMSKGKTVIVADTLNTSRWNNRSMQPVRCRGDLAFYCNDLHIAQQLKDWAHEKEGGVPKCVEDLEEVEFADMLGGIAEEHHLDNSMHDAFVGAEEDREEAGGRNPIDSATNEEDMMLELDPIEEYDNEQDMLEKIPLPGNPRNEAARKQAWLKLPRRARIAIRRLHRNFRHIPKNALIQMLRAAKCPKEYIEAAKMHRCDVCEQTKPNQPTHKVARPETVFIRS